MNNIWFIAESGNQAPSGISSTSGTNQETTTTTEVPADPNARQTTRTKPPMSNMIFMFVMIAVLFYFLVFGGQRKKQKQQKRMVQNLCKNDKVRTIGGITGTIVDVKDDEITLKIDESNNTKIKILASAIGTNLSNEQK